MRGDNWEKLHMDSVQYDRDFTESTQRLYPEIADEAMSIYTLCAMPVYHPLPPKPVPGDGYPASPKKTMGITESLRGDIPQRIVALCATTPLVYGERLEYTPTTTVPKRLPGRTFSEKSRAISDLRRLNLCISTAKFPPFGYLKRMTSRKG